MSLCDKKMTTFFFFLMKHADPLFFSVGVGCFIEHFISNFLFHLIGLHNLYFQEQEYYQHLIMSCHVLLAKSDKHKYLI